MSRPSYQEAHQAVTRDYVERCAMRSDLLNASQHLDLPKEYAASYGRLQLGRPIFASKLQINSFALDVMALHEILVSLPERAFDGDVGRYCAAIGLDPVLGELMRHRNTGAVAVHGRADAYHDGSGFRLLEYNLGSELGGTDTAQVNRAYLQNSAFERFAAGRSLGYMDTTARLARLFRRSAADIGVSEPVVALVEANGALLAHARVFTALQEALCQRGIDLLLGEIGGLRRAGGRVTLGGRSVDVVLRYFSAAEIAADPDARTFYDELLAADSAGEIRLVTSLESSLFTSKAALGLLFDPAVSATLSATEMQTVDRIVPWTRVLSPNTAAEKDAADLKAQCTAERAQFVIKPGLGYGGVGAVIGSDVTREEWEQSLENSKGTDWVVQRKVLAAPEQVRSPLTGDIENWTANWGIFVDDDGYSGAFVRALRPTDGSVVGYANPGTRGTCVFTVPDAPETPAQAVRSNG